MSFVVDDQDVVVREVVVMVPQQGGDDLVQARRPRGARSRSPGRRHRLLLADVVLPRYGRVRARRRTKPSAPSCACCSCPATPTHVTKATFIQKPFTSAELLAKIKSLFEV